MKTTRPYYIIQYLKHFLSAFSRKGFGIHSPFVYSFVEDILPETYSYYAYAPVERIRQNLLRDTSKVYVNDFGTGTSGERRVRDIARRSLKSPRDAKLLYRLAARTNPVNIIELGTSLGVTALYFAQSDTRRPVYTLEGAPQVAAIARSLFGKYRQTHVRLVEGRIEDTLPGVLDEVSEIGLLFMDANHTGEATLAYFNACLPKITDRTVTVIDDIHASPSMEEAWRRVTAHPRAHACIDLFSMGIVYFNPETPRGVYKIRHRP